jgi:hypothetical protein
MVYMVSSSDLKSHVKKNTLPGTHLKKRQSARNRESTVYHSKFIKICDTSIKGRSTQQPE